MRPPGHAVLPGRPGEQRRLAYEGTPAWHQSFDRHVLTLEQLTAIVTDPKALPYFPPR